MSNRETLDNVAVIVRSTGERTEALCTEIVKQQVPHANVVVINERPFSQAVKRSYEIGMDYGLDWTICLDADILLRHNAIAEFVRQTENTPENTFAFTGSLLDKLLGHPRVGMHLYRTKLLHQALHYIDDSENRIRPETFVKRQMESAGYALAFTTQEPLGLHDYEQYFKDIYRKALVHSQKFAVFMAYMVPMWQRLSQADPDFQAALLGYRAGQIITRDLRIDRDVYPSEIDALLKVLGLEEKEPLPIGNWNFNVIEDVVATASLPVEYIAWQHANAVKRLRFGNVRFAIEKYGLLRAIPWIVGKGAEIYGRKLQNLSAR